MTTVPLPPPVADDELPTLLRKATAGSSWAALRVALAAKPDSLASLVRIVGVPMSGKHRERAFNAIADAWAVYKDALDQGELPA